MSGTLLIIDPQNDFCDQPGAALPVPGAMADMARLAKFITAREDRLREVVVTLDSHAYVGIERPTFWQTGAAESVAPFTEILAEDLNQGRYLPRKSANLMPALEYLRKLEAAGRYRLMVWPVHCVTGTWGHNIHAGVADALNAWELATQKPVDKVLKGLNPLTEQYSAIRAEVPDPADPRTETNTALVQRIAAASGWIFVAGEALSHCVSATMADLYERLPPRQLEKIVLLTDCMSPVGGFEAQGQAFLKASREQGVRTLSAAEAVQLPADPS